MPLQHNLNAFLGAAVLGVIGAAGMFLVEHYRQEKMRTSMAKDLARLEKDMSKLKFELQQLQSQQSTERKGRLKRPTKAKKTNSVISNTTDEYFSASNIDSSDMEFYDLSEDESSQVTNSISSLDLLLKELDKKLDLGDVEDVEESLQKLEDLCLEHPGNPELLYRIGKAHHKLADTCDDKEVVHIKLNKGIDACRAALELAPEHAEVHKWFAVLIGSRSDLVSLQERINDGHLFKKHVDIAISINPNDSSLHHMLGRFDFEIASLKWYERKVATTFFGEPPNASYEDALAHFLEAERLAKFEWKENRLMIAKCKEALGQSREVVEWLEKAKISKNTSLDEKVDLDVESLLHKYENYR
ncbi:regulator of microtubule dynamics protein 1-like isoform X2 [Euwallacea similis]|uniref:regulator of microtubule dynamics protein 1-like isoform X2 n=1 Tax=Euwallacea similis TaxID=1736056 RepID=UPI00344F1E2A